MLRPDLCDYSNACIVVKRRINVERDMMLKQEIKVNLKNNAPFRSCILDHAYQKLITFIDHTEDLDIVMPMCNLLEWNYVWNYYRMELKDHSMSNGPEFRRLGHDPSQILMKLFQMKGIYEIRLS